MKSKFCPKIEILDKNEYFHQNSKFSNGNFSQKSKIENFPKIEILPKNVVPNGKNTNFINIISDNNRNSDQKPNFGSFFSLFFVIFTFSSLFPRLNSVAYGTNED